MKQYYVYRNNRQSGPIPEQQIHGKIADGELALNDMCWCEGMSDWCSIQKVFKLPPPAPGGPRTNAPQASSPLKSLETNLRVVLASAKKSIGKVDKATDSRWWLRVLTVIPAITIGNLLGKWLFGN